MNYASIKSLLSAGLLTVGAAAIVASAHSSAASYAERAGNVVANIEDSLAAGGRTPYGAPVPSNWAGRPERSGGTCE